MVLLLGVDLHYAMGAALVSVIATSSGAAAAYVREGYLQYAHRHVPGDRHHHRRHLAARMRRPGSPAVWPSFSARCCCIRPGTSGHPPPRPGQPDDRWPPACSSTAVIPTPEGAIVQRQRVKTGFGLMFVAGALSGLLGIGSGALKVIAMDQAMRIPFKVSTTTSNFMIGVTAAASAGVYLNRGYIDPGLAMPVMLGVLAGSMMGARLLPAAPTRTLRWVFAVVVCALAIEMVYSGITGRL